ncbi:hypothetical protein [uncultured Oscillibacter sp.]|uniref:hypothetical protein n=1 Tax=uncultured Oscillibacter sp. TaxID=876091 RepID=UPI00267081D2|nr:hypothetical protein [uncultured Oscillibacter sp.]
MRREENPAQRSIGAFDQTHNTNDKIGFRAADMIGIPAQRVKQARFIRVNFRRNPDPVFLFVTITAKERRAGGDCAVAFVGILVRPATAKGFSARITAPGKFAGAGAGRPGCAVWMLGHKAPPPLQFFNGSKNAVMI